MNQRIEQLLQGRGENYILPFFWQHGEDEATLRDYVRAIHAAHIGAVCVESRPHMDFGGDKWWQDMDVILDECKRHDMKVWILDDKHFPTGYANGILAREEGPELQRQHLYFNSTDVCGPLAGAVLDVGAQAHPRPNPMAAMMGGGGIGGFGMGDERRHFEDDTLLAVLAAPVADGMVCGELIDLTDLVDGSGVLHWDVPGGIWKFWVVYTSHNLGSRANYIHMIDARSCAKQIEAVYEPHWEHYQHEFGKTIAGFFSDDISFYNMEGVFGMDPPNIGGDMPLPWSGEVETALQERFGDWKRRLPMLWGAFTDERGVSALRFTYMDTITKLVRDAFSNQLGDWCKAHGVEYIGHTIDENEFHSRIGMGLGHFFRCMDGQTMGGIDAIGGQVYPGGDHYVTGRRDGIADHFTLAKLAASHAAIDPEKHGNAMCEVFGAFGWGERIRTMKYITDHFTVNGINRFVPHAFSPKAYPDPDCPPHFYAHGHNPLYRAFGELMLYMNRVSHLISGGVHLAPVALLYHAESEWAGDYMPTDAPARAMHEAQIDFDILPADVFARPERFGTALEGQTLRVNTQQYQVLLVPRAQYITRETADFVAEAQEAGFPVWFVEGRPEGICGELQTNLPETLQRCPVVSLAELPAALSREGYTDAQSDTIFPRLRVYHYRHEGEAGDLYLLANMDTAEPYCGRLTLPVQGVPALYDAVDNVLRPVVWRSVPGGVELELDLPAYNGLVVTFDTGESPLVARPDTRDESIALDGPWTVSACRAKSYPAFEKARTVEASQGFQGYQTVDPDFSGFVAYETQVELHGAEALLLEHVNDCAELFVNGQSLGIRYCPPFCYDLRGVAVEGMNTIRIEVATTLEREVAAMPQDPRNAMRALLMGGSPIQSPTGLVGRVRVYCGASQN